MTKCEVTDRVKEKEGGEKREERRREREKRRLSRRKKRRYPVTSDIKDGASRVPSGRRPACFFKSLICSPVVSRWAH